ncbi:MAG: hypothetical protein ACOVOT_09975 [Rubrivivax sp.]|jgi:hypothetical protein|nr:hypothetical protein [Rubrivivax sp.]
MPTLHRKTTKGVSEIETRAHRLAPRLRTALLMVDGKRKDAELATLLGSGTADILTALREQGFIEAVESAPAAGSSATPATPAAGSGAPVPSTSFSVAAPVDLDSHRRDAVRALGELLGPGADTMSMRMEKAKTFDELYPLVERAAQLVANTRGRTLAEAYYMRFGPRG